MEFIVGILQSKLIAVGALFAAFIVVSVVAIWAIANCHAPPHTRQKGKCNDEKRN